MSETIENTVESKNEAKAKQEADIWKLISDVDPETGLDLEWLEIRDHLLEHGPAKSLEMIFDYYQKKNPKMDAWVNYLLSCSHFTEEELSGCPQNRAYRRRVEQKVKKLMKKRETDKHTPLHEFLYRNKNIEV